jgi:hypothetical protein
MLSNDTEDPVRLPQSLTELELGKGYSRSLQRCLPNHLTKLTLRGNYVHVDLPQSLQELVVFGDFNGMDFAPFSSHLHKFRLGNILQLPQCANMLNTNIRLSCDSLRGVNNALLKLSNPEDGIVLIRGNFRQIKHVGNLSARDLFAHLLPHMF